MNCIIDFLSDIKQKEIIRLSQNQSECYEEALEIYKNLFISYFLQAKKMYSCNKCDASSICDEFKKNILEIEISSIVQFFEKMKQVYIYWIDAKVKDSLELFIKIMDDYNLWNFYDDDIKKEVFFKGRSDKDILTKWEMFHIPFNKRYLIKNQRYSLTGQPIMYLGKSVLDVIYELDVDENSIENLKISSIRVKEDLKVYDLRNDISNILNKREFYYIISDKPRYNNYTQEFFKILLSSICSFERRKEHKDYTFCEEYVIPQILAQTLKNKKYNGITYYSTKKFENIDLQSYKKNSKPIIGNIINTETNSEDNDKKSKLFNKNKYKENVALFTNFNRKHVYDEELYNKLEISSPINFYKVQEFDVKHLEDICNKIEKTNDQIGINNSQVILTIFKREFQNIKINTENYKDKSMGKMHMYHLYCVLNQILCDSSEVNKSENFNG